MPQKASPHSKANNNYKLVVNFQDNSLLPIVYGVHDQNLRTIEQALGVDLHNRGNVVTIKGDSRTVNRAQTVLGVLYETAKQGKEVSEQTVASLIDLQNIQPNLQSVGGGGAKTSAKASAKTFTADNYAEIAVGKKTVMVRGAAQAQYLQNMRAHDICFGIGPAGTGKTHLAVCFGASLLLAGEVERLVITRPAVEAGERLGFLPGDLNEKFDPYLRPIYDALGAVISDAEIAKLRAKGTIEIAPLAFMRGRTLARSFIMLDEAQNTTVLQMKMFLTRLGDHSRMVITGDPSQIDLPEMQASGLLQAIDILKNIGGIAFSRFSADDIVRHALVDKIVRAYDKNSPDKNSHAKKRT